MTHIRNWYNRALHCRFLFTAASVTVLIIERSKGRLSIAIEINFKAYFRFVILVLSNRMQNQGKIRARQKVTPSKTIKDRSFYTQTIRREVTCYWYTYDNIYHNTITKYNWKGFAVFIRVKNLNERMHLKFPPGSGLIQVDDVSVSRWSECKKRAAAGAIFIRRLLRRRLRVVDTVGESIGEHSRIAEPATSEGARQCIAQRVVLGGH